MFAPLAILLGLAACALSPIVWHIGWTPSRQVEVVLVTAASSIGLAVALRQGLGAFRYFRGVTSAQSRHIERREFRIDSVVTVASIAFALLHSSSVRGAALALVGVFLVVGAIYTLDTEEIRILQFVLAFTFVLFILTLAAVGLRLMTRSDTAGLADLIAVVFLANAFRN